MPELDRLTRSVPDARSAMSGLPATSGCLSAAATPWCPARMTMHTNADSCYGSKTRFSADEYVEQFGCSFTTFDDLDARRLRTLRIAALALKPGTAVA
jgi:hypothetical protein